MITVHDLTLPQVQEITRIQTSTTAQQAIIGRDKAESKTIMTGDEVEIAGLGSLEFADRLEALNAKNWIVWVEDSDRGDRHALMNVEHSRSVDASKPAYRIHLLILLNICDPVIVDPKVAA